MPPIMAAPDREPQTAALDGYATEGAGLVARYEAVSSAGKLRPVAHLLPAAPARVADIGAGTGVDAAWLAAQGHSVLAVEPTPAFRAAGQGLHRSGRITWLDDRLPALAATRALGLRFDFVLLSAVWAHLPEAARDEAMSSLALLLAHQGTLVLSLRHGPSPASRPTYPAPPEQALQLAAAHGLRAVLRCEAESAQAANRAAGVTWTWLGLRRAG